MAAPIIPAGGAGAAPAAPAAIHPDLTYEDYFEVFTSFKYNGWMERPLDYVPEIHDSLLKDWDDTGYNMDAEVKVHNKYIQHFFKNDPEGARSALQEYLEWLTEGDRLNSRDVGNQWDVLGVDSVRPFIQAYLDVGADLVSLRDFIQTIDEDGDEDVYDRLHELKEYLLKEIVKREAWKRRRHAVTAWAQAQPNNNNQGGGGRRRKTRRATRRRTTRRRK